MQRFYLIICFTIILVIIFSVSVSSAENKNSEIGYQFKFAGISDNGFFQMKSDKLGVSEFRDLGSGRLIARIPHTKDFTPSVYDNNKIFLGYAKQDEHYIYNFMDRNGVESSIKRRAGLEYFTSNNEEIGIKIESFVADNKNKVKLTGSDENGDIVWQKEFFGSWVQAKAPQNDFVYKHHLWLTNSYDNSTKLVNPADGETLLEFDFSIRNLQTNGYITILSSANLTEPHHLALNMENLETVWTSGKPEPYLTFINSGQLTILFYSTDHNFNEAMKVEGFVVDKDHGLKESYTFTIPGYEADLSLVSPKMIYDAVGHYICHTSADKKHMVLKDARFDLKLLEIDADYYALGAVFHEHYLLYQTLTKCGLIDINKLEHVWKFDITPYQRRVAEFDGLEYIEEVGKIIVRDIKFDSLEPYFYDISGLGYPARVAFIPTKFGLLLIPNSGNNNSFNEITLMKPGIDKPVYSHYIQSGWLKSWERTEDDEIIKLIWTYHGDKIDDDTWYLHVPTGILSTDPPK